MKADQILPVVLALLITALLVLGSRQASAHLMPAMKGTLNHVGDSGYLVLSVPFSAFPDSDLNRDGFVSGDEISSGMTGVVHNASGGVTLKNEGQVIGHLRDPLISLDPANGPGQLVLLGRIDWPSTVSNPQLRVDLFGSRSDQQRYEVLVTQVHEKNNLAFTPEARTQDMWPDVPAILLSYLKVGVEHILTGWDHLLFLLVLIAGCRVFSQVFLALTCFTAGHALTLLLCVSGYVSVSATLVEPAIAATIAVAAALELWWARGVSQNRMFARVAMVTAFSLVHGLGLASALMDLGLDDRHRFASLAGFNLGVELGQVVVASAVVLVGVVIGRFMSPQRQRQMSQAVMAGALLAGSIWMVQRWAMV